MILDTLIKRNIIQHYANDNYITDYFLHWAYHGRDHLFRWFDL